MPRRARPGPARWGARCHHGTVSTAPTLAPTTAHRAAAIAAAEAPLTAGTDRYMRAAAGALVRAARAELHDAGARRLADARVLLLVGGGHNGGDALLAGALLAERGARVSAAAATDRLHAGAAETARAAGVTLAGAGAGAGDADAESAGAAVARFLAEAPGAGGAALVIDGLTGIGARGPLRRRAAELIAPLRGAGPRGERPFRVLAVDLPSGTGVDDGTLPGPVLTADRSVTFTCPRGAHLLPPAARAVGRLDVVDLGLPLPREAPLAVRPDDAAFARLLRAPGGADHKYTRGVVGAWAGSLAYPGAAVLTCSAAVRAGAGMVRLVAPRRVTDLVLARRPEVVPAPGRAQALVLGPGTDPADAPRAVELRRALDAAVRDFLPAVIDAGALGLLPAVMADGARPGAVHVLTPHAGEAAALLTALGAARTRAGVEAAPAQAARALAEATGATVLLKATPTLVVGPGPGPVLSVDPGPGWLATAGSGDVLAGILGALLAARGARREGGGPPAEPAGPAEPSEPALTAALAVRLHALAGELAAGAGPGRTGRPLAALDLAGVLPAAWSALHGARSRHDGAPR